MKSNFSIEYSLLEADNAISFIEDYIAAQRENDDSFSLSGFSQACGIKSRSRIQEIIAGRRSITSRTLEQLIHGMNLTGLLADYFRLLAMENNPKLNTKQLPHDVIHQSKANIKHALSSRNHSNNESYFASQYFPKIYAALGEKGSDLQTIIKRTGLSKLETRQALREMINQKLCVFDENAQKYLCEETHLVNFGLKQSQNFRQFFLHSLSEVQQMAEQHFRSQNCLFFTSHFSVAAGKIPQLRKELHHLLQKYVNDSETPEGNKVVFLNAALIGKTVS